MKKMVYKNKRNKLAIAVSIIIAIIFTIISLAIAKSSYAQDNKSKSVNQREEFAVYVCNDGLCLTNLNSNDSFYIEKTNKISSPKISRNGEYVSYTTDNNLCIYNMDTKNRTIVAENISGYDWNSSENLIYSANNSGISMYNTSSNSSIKILNNDYSYSNINCDSKNNIYASKSREYKVNGDNRTEFLGIIAYDLDNEKETMVVQSKKGNDEYKPKGNEVSDTLETLGTRPVVSKISNDDRYLFIINKPDAGSASADINGFAVYDTTNNKLLENENLSILKYKDNISPNPTDSNFVAINNGSDRLMLHNKTLGVLNIKDNTFTTLIPSSQVSMNIDYSNDGENIAYSGSNALDPEDTKSLEKWNNAQHNIYSVNVNTKEINQITNSNSFDFMPMYLKDNSILFVRKDKDSYSLWKIKDGVETKISNSLYSNHIGYYGHYDTLDIMDVFRN